MVLFEEFSFKQKLLLLASCILPALVALIFVMHFAYNIPLLDQWELVPFLEKIASHQQISLSELASQHNEHRLLFPRLIMLWLASVSSWNTKYEIYLGFLLLCIIFIIALIQLMRLYKIDANMVSPEYIITACLLVSILLFSTNQRENMVWGWQIQIFINVIFLMLSILFLTYRDRIGVVEILGALIAGLVTTYSFANGILVWPIGFLLLLIRKQQVRSFIYLLSAWVLFSGVVVYMYMSNYAKPFHHPSLLMPLQHPAWYVSYVMSYLGAPMVEFKNINPKLITLGGVVGFFCILTLTYFLLKNKLFWNRISLFWHSLLLYSILSAAVTGVGRIGFGTEQAVSSRYITIGNLFWVWIILFGILIISKSSILWKRLFSMVVVLYSVVFIFYTQKNFKDESVLYVYKQNAQRALENNRMNDESLKYLYPYPAQIVSRNNFLRKEKLTFYNNN